MVRKYQTELQNNYHLMAIFHSLRKLLMLVQYVILDKFHETLEYRVYHFYLDAFYI